MTDATKTETTKTEPQAAARVELLFPLQTPNGEVKTISFRRGKAKDFVVAQRIEPDTARRELVLMAMLTHEKLVAEDMEELDLADLVNVQAAFQKLFAQPL
jgi:hypothetical protein